MLSKATKLIYKTNTHIQKQNFANLRGFVLGLLNKDDVSSPHYRAATFDPLLPLEGHKVLIRQDGLSKYETTKLKNGITVLTESASFPNVVDLGILLDVGTRDESHDTSGALLSIKNTYYKTVLKTNETVNYGMVQMSGGNFEMDYDQESTYWKANCLSHDVYDIFSMMSDCALEPRSVPAANIGMAKNHENHELSENLHTGEEFNDKLFSTAFGLRGLGLPIKGLRHNVKNLKANVLQKFQLENINPNRIYVCAGGIENHQEFVDLVQSTLGFIPPVEGNAKPRDKSEYIGGEARIPTESNEVNLALVFQSVPWKHGDMVAFNVANALLGQSSSFSTGGPGKGMHARTTKNLLNNPKYPFIDSARSLNFHFSDSGLFGLNVSGLASNGNDILSALVGEIKGLTQKIPADELQRAKNILKSDILRALERQQDRVEESVKNIKTFGRLTFQDYAAEIDKVTGEQVNSAVAKILSGNPTFVAEGGEINKLPSYDQIRNALKL